jgi:hypothetical protein
MSWRSDELRYAGFRLIEAKKADQALRVILSSETIDLLAT